MAYKSLASTTSCLICHLQNRTIGDALSIPHLYYSDSQTSAEDIGINSELTVHLTIIPPLFICFPLIIILYILKTPSFNSKLQINVDCTFFINILVICSKFVFRASLYKSDDIFFIRDSPNPFKREEVIFFTCFFSYTYDFKCGSVNKIIYSMPSNLGVFDNSIKFRC